MSSILYEQSNHSHKYLNLVVQNNTLTVSPADGSVERGSNIVNHPEDFVLSIDRYYIKSCIVPVWEAPKNPVEFVLQDISSGNTYKGTLTPSKQFYYTLHEVKKELNTALDDAVTALNTGESKSLNPPTFSFANNLWSLNSDSAFRTDVLLFMNMSAYYLFNTFEFEQLNPLDSNVTALMLLDGDTVTQRQQTMENWNPVQKIVIRSSLPIMEEFTPDRSQGIGYSATSESILTDFVIFPNDSSALLNVTFSASGNHRWISMGQSSDLNSFDVSFFFETRDGSRKPLLLPPESLIDMKLLFKEDVTRMEVPE